MSHSVVLSARQRSAVCDAEAINMGAVQHLLKRARCLGSASKVTRWGGWRHGSGDSLLVWLMKHTSNIGCTVYRIKICQLSLLEIHSFRNWRHFSTQDLGLRVWRTRLLPALSPFGELTLELSECCAHISGSLQLLLIHRHTGNCFHPNYLLLRKHKNCQIKQKASEVVLLIIQIFLILNEKTFLFAQQKSLA